MIEQNETENAAFHYRVPMSLGEPHSELDNCKYFLFDYKIKFLKFFLNNFSAGEACSAYDVCISPDFCKKILENATFMGFFMSIVIEGLEEKYRIKLDRSTYILAYFMQKTIFLILSFKIAKCWRIKNSWEK